MRFGISSVRPAVPGPSAPMLAGLAVLLMVSGCGGGSSLPAHPAPAAPANRPATAPGVLAARTTAQTEFGLLAGGDYGHAWDLWTDAAKKTISRAHFITSNAKCSGQLGLSTTVVAARAVSGTVVMIGWRRQNQTGTATMIYVGGVWRFEPGPGSGARQCAGRPRAGGSLVSRSPFAAVN